ncbi:MAG: alkaline phosphatase family protein [Planctomycetaceae bacterium]
MKPSRILLLEFNELCPGLLNKWMADGLLPNFRAFHSRSDVFVSSADTDDPHFLEPWIQWFSMHSGLSIDQHGIFHLTDGQRAAHDDIWSVLARAGKSVGNGGSMNVRRLQQEGSFFLSDPWCTASKAWPTELQVFQDFVAENVQEYSNTSRKKTGAKRFLQFMARHGLRPKTVAWIAKRLLQERTTDRGSQWKRAVVLDMLVADLFLHLFRKYRPDFSTLFLNSTAHFQHSYWRHMDPAAFVNQPSQQELDQYGKAILYGYQRMDVLLGDLMKLERDGVMLILSTALSQQPFLRHEATGGQHFYRPHDVGKLLTSLGVQFDSADPVMTHQYMLRVQPSERDAAVNRLRALTMDGTEAFEVSPSDDGGIYFGCQISRKVSGDEVITDTHAGTTVPFFDLMYKIDATKSGCHHPDGVLWFRTGNHRVHSDRVSILDVFPTVTEFFGVEYDSRDSASGHTRSGQSLLPLLRHPKLTAGQRRQNANAAVAH